MKVVTRMKMKHYMDIERLKPSFADGFAPGDHIIIEEKIDGACFSLRYDPETDSIAAFSRRRQLDEANNLRGALQWAQAQDKEKIKKILGSNMVAFGEFLVRHTVPYPDERYNQPYFFDVYDTASQSYLTYEEAREIIDLLDFNFVPVFYDGEFTSWDDVKKYLGQTDLGGEYGEGVVVKNQTRLNDPNTRMPFYTKIVTDKFRETKGQRHNKPVDMDKLAERTRVQELVDSVVTEARVRKLVLKMVDDGLIPEEWDNHDMGTIAKNLGKAVYYDCQKEEPEVVEEAGPMFGKTAGVTAMRIVREILEERMVA